MEPSMDKILEKMRLAMAGKTPEDIARMRWNYCGTLLPEEELVRRASPVAVRVLSTTIHSPQCV